MYLRFFGGGSEVTSSGVDLSGLLESADRGRAVDLRGLPAPKRRGVAGIGAMVRTALKYLRTRSGRVSAGLDERV
jgi:hypothetical protein